MVDGTGTSSYAYDEANRTSISDVAWSEDGRLPLRPRRLGDGVPVDVFGLGKKSEVCRGTGDT